MRGAVYVDMDAFYVSCELLRHPELQGTPVAVSADPKEGKGRGVVLSASYEARRFGLRSAQPVSQAWALCPTATYLRPDFPFYQECSRKVMALLKSRSELARAFSIDEAAYPYELPSIADEAEGEGRTIQDRLRNELGLPSSVGIAPSLALAKIASDRAKPGGVVAVLPGEVPAFLSSLPVRAVPGIGPVTERGLASEGVTTVGELSELPPRELQRLLGSPRPSIVRWARGEVFEEPWPAEEGPRSLGAMHTFERDSADTEEIARGIDRLAEEILPSLRREQLTFRTVTIRVRFSDFSQVQRSRTLPGETEDAELLHREARTLLHELLRARRARTRSLGPEGNRGGPPRVRTIGVTVQGLRPLRRGQSRLDAFPPGPAPGPKV